MAIRPDDLENVISKLKNILPPVRDTGPLKTEKPLSSDAVFKMIAKYGKLILLLKGTNQNDEKIALLEKQLTKLNAVRDILEEKEKTMWEEHDGKKQKQRDEDIKVMQEQLRESKEGLEQYFEKYAKDFELFREQLKNIANELQEQLENVSDQLREVNEQIIVVKVQTADVEEKIVSTEQSVNDAEIAVAKELEKEWLDHGLSIPPPDFLGLIRDCAHDKNNPLKDQDDLTSRAVFKLHGIVEQHKKQMLDSINKKLAHTDAEQEQINKEIAKLEKAEADIREHLREKHGSFSSLSEHYLELEELKNKGKELQAKKAQLENKETELVKQANKITQEIKGVEQELQGPKDGRPVLQDTTRPTLTPFSTPRP
ncbi:MAG: hypothetical protein ACD_21C00089G0002 [uncultured bacterium]|nr:MAG: hypothetical protein ACD_21C00089G0002 [uncultured bacterium]